mmetsp:Transcript_18392/g.46055  ORF Transcript_18392/g.46055 Transcript_18392/m.46055 type:complete len:80 (-) Transcript_18392:162-401(-)
MHRMDHSIRSDHVQQRPPHRSRCSTCVPYNLSVQEALVQHFKRLLSVRPYERLCIVRIQHSMPIQQYECFQPKSRMGSL